MSSSIKDLIAAQQAYNDLVSVWADGVQLASMPIGMSGETIELEAKPLRPYQDGDLQVGDVFTVGSNAQVFIVTQDDTRTLIVSGGDGFIVERIEPVRMVYPQFAMRVSSEDAPVLSPRRCYNADGQAPAIITSKRRAARQPSGLWVDSLDYVAGSGATDYDPIADQFFVPGMSVQGRPLVLSARRAYFND
jgi:hypothetical protein